VASRRRLPSTAVITHLRDSPPPFGPLAHLVSQLGRDHPALALAGNGPPGDLLGAAFVVGVGAIDEVDARLEGVAHDLLRGLLVGLAAEHHRAQAQGRYLQAGAAETAILHGRLLRESQRRRADPGANSPATSSSATHR